MKVAVTGASGYVGGIILNAFRQEGIEATAFSRRRVEGSWIFYSLETDPSQLPLDEFDVLVHAAYDFSLKNERFIFETNVESGIRLFERASSQGVKRMVFISSMSSYSGCRSTYGKAKYRLEQAVVDLGGVVIRPGLVWGMHAGGVMGALVKMVKKSPIIPLLVGKHEPALYLVHEKDLGQCVVQVSHEKNPEIIYTAAHPERVGLSAIIRGIESRLGLRRVHLPISWSLVLAGLRFGEAAGLSLPFRSDSLLGLVYSASCIEGKTAPFGVNYRSFES